MSSTVDLFVLYRIIRDLTTPFEETKAFELGLINKDGKRLKKAKTSDEKKAMGFYERFVFNIKRLMGKVGLQSRLATFAAALFLLKEASRDEIPSDEEILKEVSLQMDELSKNSRKSYRDLQEDIANVTGTAVAGTGDTGVHWKKHPYRVGPVGDRRPKGRYINGVAYLKRALRKKKKKKREED